MAKVVTNLASLPSLYPLTIARRTRVLFAWCAVLGVVAFVVGLQVDAGRAWANYLLGYYFWMCLGLAGVFFTALQYVTGAVWSIALRRVAEAMTSFLPLALVLFLILLAGVPHLYEWSHLAGIHDHMVQHLVAKKTSYLNIPFFTFRQITFLLLWGGFAWFLVRNSLRQDSSADAGLTQRNVEWSAIFILIFAVTFTLTGFDLMMSLEPEWFSTIFGVYCFAGLFVSGVAMITVIAVPLYRRGAYGAYLTAEHHLFDLGKLMLAFTVFWAYIAFSQFMLIWYADLPEETGYLMRRMLGDWQSYSWALLLVHFILPFAILLMQGLKKKPRFLFVMGLWMLVAQYMDCYWMIFPKFFPAPVFGWMELGIFLGFAGLFGTCVSIFLSRASLVPVGDPRLLESVNFHQA